MGTIRDFPIPNCNQQPDEDLYLARRFLSIASLITDTDIERGLNRDEVGHVRFLLEQVDDMLRPLQRYLDGSEQSIELYRAARRAEIVQPSDDL